MPSSTNTEEEMAKKRRLYFAQGAEEVWICSKDGAMRFFVPESEIEKSLRVRVFPKQIAI
jgi:Uma2 family endonuclease